MACKMTLGGGNHLMIGCETICMHTITWFSCFTTKTFDFLVTKPLNAATTQFLNQVASSHTLPMGRHVEIEMGR
jgi:hypothetical protein